MHGSTNVKPNTVLTLSASWPGWCQNISICVTLATQCAGQLTASINFTTCHWMINTNHCTSHSTRPVFTHGPPGPGLRAANFQGRHIKKNRDWSMVCGKKRLSTREKFKGDYTENNVGTEFSILAIENDRNVKLDFENVISVFASTKARRRSFS